MKAGIYARVSTKDQNASMQLEALRSYCKKMNYEIYREYVDHGISGKNDKRTALNNLLLDARQRLIDIVLVWKIDRFARSVKHFHTFVGELQNKNIEFTAITQPFDTTSPSGRLMMNMLAAFAEFETDVRAERQKAGIERAKKMGKHLGRPRKKVTPPQVSTKQQNNDTSQGEN